MRVAAALYGISFGHGFMRLLAPLQREQWGLATQLLRWTRARNRDDRIGLAREDDALSTMAASVLASRVWGRLIPR